MKLTQDIIRQIIKEELEKQMMDSDREEQASALFQQISQFPKPDAVKIVDKLRAQVSKLPNPAPAAQPEEEGPPANRSEIQEMGCAPQQDISMGIPSDHEDHEGSMAKRQMFKTAMYSKAILDMIDDGEEFPAWIQSKMTKIADYIGAVKHYLEYDHVMGEAKLTKKQIKGRDDDAKEIMKSTKKQYGKEEGERAAYAIATNIQKEKAKKKK